MIVIIVVGILAGIVSVATTTVQKKSRDYIRNADVTVISTALEKYYRKNGEYPSVAFMTSQDVNMIKQKLKLVSTKVLKFPLTDEATASSVVTANPSTTRLLYSANTSDNSKNTQCQTDINGYCDGFQLQYVSEADGSTIVAKSLHDTFTPIADEPTGPTLTCNPGDTLNGSTCTHTYAATYQNGTSGYYYCPNGGSLSGTTCSYTASSTNSCPAGWSNSGSGCYDVENPGAGNSCPSGYSYDPGWSEQGGACVAYASYTVTYSCPNGGSRSGTTCSYGASYSSGSSGYYYCPSGGTLSGTTCTYTYPAS